FECLSFAKLEADVHQERNVHPRVLPYIGGVPRKKERVGPQAAPGASVAVVDRAQEFPGLVISREIAHRSGAIPLGPGSPGVRGVVGVTILVPQHRGPATSRTQRRCVTAVVIAGAGVRRLPGERLAGRRISNASSTGPVADALR